MNWIKRLFWRRDTHRDEDQLRLAVAAERARLDERQRRAERVLEDFHRAESVIRGRHGATDER